MWMDLIMLELVKLSHEKCAILIGLRRTIWYHSPAVQAQDVTWLQKTKAKHFLRLVNKARSIFLHSAGAYRFLALLTRAWRKWS